MKRLLAGVLALTLAWPVLATTTPRRAPIVHSPLRKAVATPRAPVKPSALPTRIVPVIPTATPRPEPTLSEVARWRFYSYP
jgi:hypothetical protein